MENNDKEIASNLVIAWLDHESKVSQEVGRTSVSGQSISVKEVAQAYLDIFHTVFENELPDNLKDSSEIDN